MKKKLPPKTFLRFIEFYAGVKAASMKRNKIVELAHESLKSYPEYSNYSKLSPSVIVLQDFYSIVSKTDFINSFKEHMKSKAEIKNNYIYKKAEYKGFYYSEEWLSLAKEVRSLYGCKCMKCKCINKEMHVDHVIPRSKDKSVELDIKNMQVLCKDCNFEKSNLNSIDYRTDTHIKKLNKYLGTRPMTMTSARLILSVWADNNKSLLPESKVKELNELLSIAGLIPNNYID